MALLLTLVSVGLATYTLIRYNSIAKSSRIPPPRDTLLPFLSPEQASQLPYPPNALPATYVVDSPYGTMRVYERGPEEGGKVIMVPGDSSPAPILGLIAYGLVGTGLWSHDHG